MKALKYVGTVLFIEAIIICNLASFHLINPLSAAIQSFAILLVFNILFTSLFFQLNGRLNNKLLLLVFGNFIGLCWNFILNSFIITGTTIFGSTFNNISLVFFPFLSSLWIVSFWSLSITVLHRDSFGKVC